MSLVWGLAHYPAARRVSSLGTPLRLGITHRGIDWLDIQSRKLNPSNGSTAGGQPAGVFWFCGRLPRTGWVASPPVGQNLIRLTQSFFKIFEHFECTAPHRCGAFFFAVFSKILAKNFISSSFFIVIYLSHLMHSVGAIFILSDSEYTPDLLSARGVTAGSRCFFVLQGKFFAKKSGPESARRAREST